MPQRYKVVSPETWLEARRQFLRKEKAFTRLRDRLSRERRSLPWERVDKTYAFEGPDEVDGFFYWLIRGTPHYGRFTEMERPGRIQHTWVSPNTLGEESTVTVTFQKKGENTLMTLVHSDLPDTDGGRGHEKGWNYSLDIFPEQFTDASRKRK